MILPTSKFVVLQFVPKGKTFAIIMPDGAHPTSGGDFVVLATGPECPSEPPMPKGTKILLRGDAPRIQGVDEKEKIGIIHYEWIMAVQEEEPVLTDSQIDAIAGN